MSTFTLILPNAPPSKSVRWFQNAVSFLGSLPEVANGQIGALGICAGAGYTLVAASQDNRIKSVVATASWLHDAEAVKLFYGGDAGVQKRISAAQADKKKYEE